MRATENWGELQQAKLNCVLIEIDRRSRHLLRGIIVEDASGTGASVPDKALSVDIEGTAPFKVRAHVLVPIRFGSVRKTVEADIPPNRDTYRLGAKLGPVRLVFL